MTSTTDGIDELAALFLTGPDDVERQPPAAQSACSELVLVGHLPVRAGVWLAPYVDAVARAAGPTALVRLDDRPAHLQLLRPTDSAAEMLREPPALRSCIQSLASVVKRWVVRPDAGADMHELVTAGADRITLLSGGDQVALCAAYRLVKTLSAAAADRGVSVPRLGLAVLGCDQASAERAVDNLNRTASAHLEVQIELALCLPQVDAGLMSSPVRRFAGETSPSVGELLQWIAEPVVKPVHKRPTKREDHPRPGVHTTRSGPARTPPSPSPSRSTSPPPPSPAAAPRSTPPRAAGSAVPTPGSGWVDRGTVKLRPKAAMDVEPKAPCRPFEPDAGGRPVPLAKYVEGLEPLPVRCPNRELIEIAVDGAGRLHLLGTEQSLRDMQVAQRWALEHNELLSMALPDHHIEPRATPRLHVFTDRPLSVADLHGGDIQLHVLAPVQVGTATAWYSAPLNA